MSQTSGLQMDFSRGIFQSRREWDNVFKILKEKNQSIKNTIPDKVVLQR